RGRGREVVARWKADCFHQLDKSGRFGETGKEKAQRGRGEASRCYIAIAVERTTEIGRDGIRTRKRYSRRDPRRLSLERRRLSRLQTSTASVGGAGAPERRRESAAEATRSEERRVGKE